MQDWESMSHVKWECKYHVVFIPKYRHKVFYGKLRSRIGPILRDLCRQRGVDLVEGKAVVDHIHLCVSVPPKYSIAMVIGFLKGKSAIRIHRELMGQEKNFTGMHFWARGYCVSTVGLNEEEIRRYIREQEEFDQNQSRFEFKSWITIGPYGAFLSQMPPSGGLPNATRSAGGSLLGQEWYAVYCLSWQSCFGVARPTEI